VPPVVLMAPYSGPGVFHEPGMTSFSKPEAATRSSLWAAAGFVATTSTRGVEHLGAFCRLDLRLSTCTTWCGPWQCHAVAVSGVLCPNDNESSCQLIHSLWAPLLNRRPGS
jgi:hypothetical protein